MLCIVLQKILDAAELVYAERAAEVREIVLNSLHKETQLQRVPSPQEREVVENLEGILQLRFTRFPAEVRDSGDSKEPQRLAGNKRKRFGNSRGFREFSRDGAIEANAHHIQHGGTQDLGFFQRNILVAIDDTPKDPWKQFRRTHFGVIEGVASEERIVLTQLVVQADHKVVFIDHLIIRKAKVACPIGKELSVGQRI